MRATLGSVYGRIIVRRRIYAVYTTTAAQDHGVLDEELRVYDVGHPPPMSVVALLRCHSGRLTAALMMSRLQRHGAVLLVLLDGEELAASGWIQTWQPLLREFWWLSRDAICLGPYWTHPDYRGRGLYGRLLLHSLAECHRRFDKDVFIWAEDNNAASKCGIEKAGFHSVGIHRVSTYMCGLIRCHKVVRPAISQNK